jgi:hypothetical protein
VSLRSSSTKDSLEQHPPGPSTEGQKRRRVGLRHGLAFVIYAVASLALFGGPILRDPLHSYLGTGVAGVPGYTDPSFYMWNFVWWPHALARGLNPLFSHVAWAPDGFSLASAQTAPAISLLLSPVTKGLGPVATYNVVMFLAPVLGAWTAYLLCWRLTRSFWPSVAGGYFFGFSSYELAHLTDHPNLALTFLVPLAVYLVCRRLEGSISPTTFMVALSALLVLQFSISPEIFLTMTLFGAVIGAVAVWRYGRAPGGGVRPSALGVLRSVGGAYAVSFLVVAPYLVFAFTHGLPRLPQSWPFGYKTDLANLVVPTRLHRVGGGFLSPVSDRFTAPVDESAAYIGTLLVVILLFVVKGRRNLLHRILTWSLGISILSSLGPSLTVVGTPLLVLPWMLFAFLPVTKMALPARFMLYAWLAIAVMVSLWLDERSRRTWTRWALVVISALLLLPNTSVPYWHNRLPVPRFFSDGTYRSYVRQGENVLIIPYAGNGFSMAWQANSGMWFSMPEGRLCPLPPGFQTWPIIRTLFGGPQRPTYRQDLLDFLSAKEITKIVVVRGTPGDWQGLFSVVGTKPRTVSDVVLYEVPHQVVGSRPNASRPRAVVEDLRGECG